MSGAKKTMRRRREEEQAAHQDLAVAIFSRQIAVEQGAHDVADNADVVEAYNRGGRNPVALAPVLESSREGERLRWLDPATGRGGWCWIE